MAKNRLRIGIEAAKEYKDTLRSSRTMKQHRWLNYKLNALAL